MDQPTDSIMDRSNGNDDLTLRDNFSCNDEIVVGLEKETENLLDQLTGVTDHLELISIVGMPGLGKSTLARKVYNDPLIVYHFHVRAWISISQLYHLRDLFIGLLRCVTDLTDVHHEMNDNELAEMLYKCLKRKRYLIVLDDIWNHEAWDNLKQSFPNDKIGSKIMFTSRLQDLNLSTHHVLHLRFLTENESACLLEKTIFCSGRFPVELIRIGKEIAKRCRGLPLAIVVISGILKSKDASVRWWGRVAENVNSVINSDGYHCMDTLALSYYHLPQQLRTLFLYFSLFPEDFEIPARKLIWLWVAEGLIIEKSGRKSLEELAKDYLTELLKRSLVVVSKIGSDGGIKTCRIHDLLRDLCIRKAKEEKFSPRMYRYLEKGTIPWEILDHLRVLDLDAVSILRFPSEVLQRIRKAKEEKFSPRMYRYLEKGTIPWETLDHLRVLDLDAVSILLFPSEVLQLVHLRYLAIKARNGSPPASLSKLLNLQTFIISPKRNVTIPQSTWKLPNLRHLLIKSGENTMEGPCSEDVPTQEGSPLLLESLQTLSQVYPSPYCKDILESATNLRKLGLISDLGNLKFPSLNFLDRLETLKLLNTKSFPEAAQLCNPIMFPERLKKLTLSNTSLAWMEMWIIGLLPNLEVLKLKFHSCTGKHWETSDGGFQRLKFLKFQDLDIVKWEASCEHFPSLQRIVVHRCPNLLGIPSSLGNICTLELIEVSWCSDSAAISALDIHNEQKSQGNDLLKVLTTLCKDLRPHGKRKRVTFEDFLGDCSESVIYINLTFLLHMIQCHNWLKKSVKVCALVELLFDYLFKKIHSEMQSLLTLSGSATEGSCGPPLGLIDLGTSEGVGLPDVCHNKCKSSSPINNICMCVFFFTTTLI